MQDRVRSLDRALDVLEALAAGGELGVTEVAARTNLVASTTYRLLTTLVQRGYATQNPVTGRYALGHKIAELAGTIEARTGTLREAAHPHLERIAALTHETVNLVVLDGDRVIYVDQAEGDHSVRMFTQTGSSALAHTTGSGKAMLAFKAPGAVAKLYARRQLERLTPRTHTTLEALEADLAAIRARGYALDHEEHEEGASCVATPIFDRTGEPCAALSVSGPTTRIIREDTPRLAALLRDHAAQISARLGYVDAA